MTTPRVNGNLLRVYTLGPPLTEEQMAVTFAMTSRSPEPFDQIADQISETRAADFHEKWVVGYGHSSVAEHAVVHMAIENASRLTIDELEGNRLASYTEKSSRFQVIGPGSYHVPAEVVESGPGLTSWYLKRMNTIFESYSMMVKDATEALKTFHPQGEKESNNAWNTRRRRMVTDAVRNVLPTATLTNVGITANARTLEHAISKLMSSPLQETQSLGAKMRNHGRDVVPTLIKYADYNPYLASTNTLVEQPSPHQPTNQSTAKIWHYEPDAIQRLADVMMFKNSNSFVHASAENENPAAVIANVLKDMGPHDQPPREFEIVNYLIEITMDYGALREFRRHRMMTPLSQTLGIHHNHHTPEIIETAGQTTRYERAIEEAEQLYHELSEVSPLVAQYAVTHAHYQHILVSMNLREVYHLVKLRTAANAHPSIQKPVQAVLDQIRSVHPELVSTL